MEVEVQPVSGVSLVDAACAALRAEVLAARVPVGEPLTEHALAARFDIARPTAKAAVERLVAEGLLVRSRHRSAHVPELTAADVEDVFGLRTVLEQAAVRVVAERREVPVRARRAVAEMEEDDAADDVARLVQADLEFHRGLVEAAGSPRLDRAHRQIMGEAQLAIVQDQVLLVERSVGVAAEHRAILDAVADGDVAEADRLVVDHLASVSARLRRDPASA